MFPGAKSCRGSDTTEQGRVDQEVAWSKSRFLAHAARLERQSSELNRWVSSRERAYTLFLSARSMRATARSRREQSALIRKRALVQINNAHRILECARELHRCSPILAEGFAGERREGIAWPSS